MKQAILGYLAGLCQAASAALLASAMIIPEAMVVSIAGSSVTAVIGLAMVILKEREK